MRRKPTRFSTATATSAARSLRTPAALIRANAEVLERERLGTTGVGNGIAIPHGKLPELKRLYGLFARLDQPIDFDSIDEQPVDLIFLLLAPESAGADPLKALARVSRLLRDAAFRERLVKASSAVEMFQLIKEEDSRY